MIVEHRGVAPRIHPTAWVAPTELLERYTRGVFNGARIGGGRCI